MADPQTEETRAPSEWWDVAGWSHFLNSFSMSLNPGKLGLAFLALLFSLVWGMVLDSIWLRAGGGIPETNVTEYALGHIPAAESTAEKQTRVGVFDAWWKSERAAMDGAVTAVRELHFFGGGAPIRPLAIENVFPDVAPAMLGRMLGMVGCVVLMVKISVAVFAVHWLYAILFLGGSLIVWSWLGGAICRMHAVQFAREERVGLNEALSFSGGRLFGGFVAAPLAPLVFIGVLGLILVVGGLFLSIPWVGDILGGIAFGFAIVCGFVIAFATIASVVSAFLFWPAIATDAYDGAAAVLHTVSYVQTRVFRALWYLFVSIVLLCIAWILLWLFVWFALACTHAFVGLTAIRDGGLSQVWTIGEPGRLFGTASRELSARDQTLRFLIAAWVFLTVGLAWAYLVNLWLGFGTVAYFLLRKHVDSIGMSEVATTGPEPEGMAPAAPQEPEIVEVTPPPAQATEREPEPSNDSPANSPERPDDDETKTS